MLRILFFVSFKEPCGGFPALPHMWLWLQPVSVRWGGELAFLLGKMCGAHIPLAVSVKTLLFAQSVKILCIKLILEETWKQEYIAYRSYW